MRSGGGDPHRVLGVGHDASEVDVKRAYRALAKRHHPDGGHGSIARFLEIQAAYELLIGDARSGAPTAQTRRPGATPASSAPWTRRPRPGASRPRDPGPANGRNQGAGRAAAGPEQPRRTSGRRRATLGSTSYDDAEGIFEPGWGGGSWYGQSSGTYWTVNPREYADPRKHGPEYQARARRTDASGSPSMPAAAEQPRQPTAARARSARSTVVARIIRAWRRGTISA